MNASDIVAVLSGVGTMITAIYVGINTYRDKTAEKHRKAEKVANDLMIEDFRASVDFNKRETASARAELAKLKEDLDKRIEAVKAEKNIIIERLQIELSNEKAQIQAERATSANLREQILVNQKNNMEVIAELKANDQRNVARVAELEVRVAELENREAEKNSEILKLKKELAEKNAEIFRLETEIARIKSGLKIHKDGE